MASMEVATTILQQLGGNRFRAMTGAHSFTGDTNSLTFKIPQRPESRIFAVKVILTPADDYTVEFWAKKGRFDVTKAASFDGVYFDQLQELFERQTGLRTSL